MEDQTKILAKQIEELKELLVSKEQIFQEFQNDRHSQLIEPWPYYLSLVPTIEEQS